MLVPSFGNQKLLMDIDILTAIELAAAAAVAAAAAAAAAAALFIRHVARTFSPQIDKTPHPVI